MKVSELSSRLDSLMLYQYIAYCRRPMICECAPPGAVRSSLDVYCRQRSEVNNERKNRYQDRIASGEANGMEEEMGKEQRARGR